VLALTFKVKCAKFLPPTGFTAINSTGMLVVPLLEVYTMMK
jgi:hypothetical protein